jgi:hypothetical protein
MSFDSAFNYSNAVTHINSQITSKQNELTIINAELTMLQGISGYTTMLAPKIEQATSKVDNLTSFITSLQNILTEITNVSGLSSESKNALYNFFINTNWPKADFMIKMLFNTTAMLTDPDFIALSTDEENDADCKTCIAKAIIEKFNINQTNIHSLVQLYAHLTF